MGIIDGRPLEREGSLGRGGEVSVAIVAKFFNDLTKTFCSVIVAVYMMTGH